jgi:hypothetical protein
MSTVRRSRPATHTFRGIVPLVAADIVLPWNKSSHDGEGAPLSRPLIAGAVLWAGYTLLYSLLNPVVLDEVVVPAQIIAGAVHYPAGHPHDVFYREAFSLTNYLAAGGWRLGLDAIAISRIRNTWFLFSSVFTSFALALLLARQARWAHVSAVLTACNLAVPLGGAYPVFVSPSFWSHGHIGLHTALLATVMVLAGYVSAGGFLLGLIPSIHAAMALVLWPWGLVYLLAHKLRRVVTPALLGVIVCALLAALIWILAPSSRVDSPYDLQLDGATVRQTFITYTDIHRQRPSLNSLAYGVHTLAFLAMGALFVWLPSGPRHVASAPSPRATGAWLLLLAAMSWVLVYGSWIAQRWLGTLPTWVDIWMPYRFSNVSAALMLPLCAALLARLDARLCTAGRRVLTALTLALLIGAGLQTLMTGEWATVLQPRHQLLVVLWGLVLGSYFAAPEGAPDRSRSAVRLALGGTVLIVGLGIYGALGWRPTFEFGAASILAGGGIAIGARIGRRWRIQGGHRWQYVFDGVLALVCVAAGLATLHSRYPDRAVGTAGMTVSTFDRELSAWLSQHARAQELLVAPIDPVLELQAKTAHPVLVEAETLWIMSYAPSLSGVIGAITRDVYGVDYSITAQIERLRRTGSLADPVWREIWTGRSRTAWTGLRQKYGMRLVLSPMPLDLPVVLRGADWVLYEIPESVS